MYPDPSVCRVDGVYYLITSTFEYLPGLPIHASTDLETWSPVGHAIHDPGQVDYRGVADSGGMFAPTIRHHDGVFYVACTQMGETEQNFYVTARDAAGPWSAPVVLKDARGIDQSLFFHEGRVWWTGTRLVAEPTFDGETEVWLRELDLERGELIGPETVIWTRTQYRAVWAEAPHLYHRNGWFYLMTAEGGTAFEHSVMIARSRDVAGPYLPCPRNPVLTHRHLGSRVEVQSVGHGDLFAGDGDEWWMVVLATRPIAGHHILGRETHLARVTWEDDWPVVNAGLGRLHAPVARAGSWGSRGVPSASDFLGVRGFPDFAHPSEAGLRLSSTGQPTALLRRLTSIESVVTITLDNIDRDAVAGLVLRQSDEVQTRIEVARAEAGDGLRADLVVRLHDDAVLTSIELPRGPLVLAAHVTEGGIRLTVTPAGQAEQELGRVPLSALSTETAGGFVGTTFGPFVAGPPGASVDFTAWSQDDRG